MIRNRIFTYLLLILQLLIMGGCSIGQSTEEDAIRVMVSSIHTQYPAATLQDIYKTCYQDRFGAEHAAPDSVRALAYFLYELNQMANEALVNSHELADDTLRMPLIEPCGWRHRYERVSLEAIRNGEITTDELLHEFLEAARAEVDTLSESWSDEWGRIEAIALAEVPTWQNDTLIADLRYAASINAAVHHSEAFRTTYHPHYRIRKTLNK